MTLPGEIGPVKNTSPSLAAILVFVAGIAPEAGFAAQDLA